MAAARQTVPTPLRSAHSEPRRVLADGLVVVTSGGKTFHRDTCTFIHGPAVPKPAEQAIADGYSPCTRCLPR